MEFANNWKSYLSFLPCIHFETCIFWNIIIQYKLYRLKLASKTIAKTNLRLKILRNKPYNFNKHKKAYICFFHYEEYTYISFIYFFEVRVNQTRENTRYMANKHFFNTYGTHTTLYDIAFIYIICMPEKGFRGKC